MSRSAFDALMKPKGKGKETEQDKAPAAPTESAPAAPAAKSYAAPGVPSLSSLTKNPTPGASIPREMPWVEKYRPKNLNEVAAQEHTINVLRKALDSANLPHMLFYGPAGTGKTSTILALCKQMFGPELFHSRVLELNASDERGITIVREKIKNFAKTAVTQKNNQSHGAPPYKIIILDEADSMTQDAQSALRRIMETYSRITRFCLICNYVTRIIEPITSRCSKFRFKPLDQGNTLARLQEICEKESVHADKQSLEAVIKASDGDMRRAITYLQTGSRLHTSEDDPITTDSVQEIAGVVPNSVMGKLTGVLGVDSMETGDERPSFNDLRSMLETITRDGFSATQLLSQLHDALIMNPGISSPAKAKIALVLGEADKCLTDGADEGLQLLNCCAKIRKALITFD